MPDSQPDGTRSPTPFKDCWLAETLRMREAQWGPLEDVAEVRRARAQARSFGARVLLRAHYVGKREKLDLLIASWSQGARIALIVMAVLAAAGGAGMALGALGDGSRPVNLLLALVALLGLNTAALLLWLLSFLLKGGNSAWLGESWLWLTHKLTRGPDAALAPRALIELLSRQRALPWVLGGISHGLWTLALTSMLVTMLGLLSLRRYQFNWETTLLSPDVFTALTTWLGWLPRHLGFVTPPETIIRISDGLHSLPGDAQGMWSSWLIGCLVVYGLLPRLLALAISLIRSKQTLAQLAPDLSLPGYAELRDRLSPSSEKTGIDAPEAPGFQTRVHPHTPSPYLAGQPVLAGIELPPDTPWPPGALPSGAADAGVIDNRAQRRALLDALQQHTPGRLLLVCDPQQTPDRGTVALLADLASLAEQSRILLLSSSPVKEDAAPRATTWFTVLQTAGFAPDQLTTDPATGLAWLAADTPPDPQKGAHHAQD